LAEREGFEPPEPFGSTVFKTAAFDRSATSPDRRTSARVARMIPERFREVNFVATAPSRYTLSTAYTRRQVVQVFKWGNGLAVRLPASVVEALALEAGDRIRIRAAGKRTCEIERSPGTGELLAPPRRFRGRLPKDFRFDRIEANERR
jgi:antitoxin MazE